MYRTNRLRVLCVAAVFILGVILTFRLDRGSTVHFTHQRAKCLINMKRVFTSLHSYVIDSGDVPRGADGVFSPSGITQSKDGMFDRRCVLCTEDDQEWCGLTWVPNITLDEAKVIASPSQDAHSIVLLCHDPEHLHRLSPVTDNIVLFSNGVVLMLDCDPVKYRDWYAKEFIAGARTYPPGAEEYLEMISGSPSDK